MKLIDLLVKKTVEDGWKWPEGAVEAEVFTYEGGLVNFWTEDGHALAHGAHAFKARCLALCEIESVSRAQYEAALAKNDGWIEWGGGERPVHGTVYVDVKLRSGHVITKRLTAALYWNHYTPNGDGEITSYRLHRDINSRASHDRLEQDLNECIGQDVVNHPSHYTKGSIECIDAIDSATTGKSGIEAVCVANVIKYLWRYEEKNGLEDVKKAQWYLNKLISELESN